MICLPAVENGGASYSTTMVMVFVRSFVLSVRSHNPSYEGRYHLVTLI